MIEISQTAREALQGMRCAGMMCVGDQPRILEIIQLAIERETKSLREQLALAEEDAWKYRLLGR